MINRLTSFKLHLLLLFIVSISLHRQYLLKKIKLNIWQSFPHFTLRSPYTKIENHSLNINYKRLVDIKFKFNIRPNICSTSPFLVIVIVPSDLSNSRKRAVIRNTWGRANDVIKIIFTMGVSGYKYDNITKNIIFESNLHKDIVQGNFVDSYHNLSYKHMMGLKWVTHHCPAARYVIKTDDDCFINTGMLFKFIARQLSPWGAKGLIACTVYWKNMVERSHSSKWQVSKEEWPLKIFPPHCSGGFILYSQDVLPYLVEASQRARFLHIEDAFVTGVVVLSIGKSSIHRTDMSYMYMDLKTVIPLMLWEPSQLRRKLRPFVYGPFDVSIYDIMDLWALYNFSDTF